MKNQQITYQITIAPSTIGCLLLQREITKTQSIWSSRYFKYEQKTADDFFQMNQLDWSLSWSQAPPKELGEYFQSLYAKAHPKTHKLIFALALPAPYWFLDQSSDASLDAAHAVLNQIAHYMSSASILNWIYDFQPGSTSANNISKALADQKYFLLSPVQVISNLKQWLLPFSWQWSIIDIDFCCLLRSCRLFLDSIMDFSDQIVLFMNQSSEEIVIHVFNNHKYIYFLRKRMDFHFDLYNFFKNEIIQFLIYLNINLILFSGDKIKSHFFDDMKIEKKNIFDLSRYLIFPSLYLVNMGLLFRYGWNHDDVF